MAEEITQPTQPSLGRYIVIALLFMLIFVGLAYLAYRFSRSNSTGGTTPTPSPSLSYDTGAATGQVYPAPIVSPQPAPRYVPSFPPVVKSLPYPQPTPTGNIFIVSDGQGNIFSDKPLYTHNEHTAITLQQLADANRLALAQLQARSALDSQRQNSQNQIEAFKAQQQTALAQQRANLDAQLALQRLRNEVALAQLANQRFALQQQTMNQPGTRNYTQLVQAQADAQERIIRAQAEGQAAVVQAQANRDTTLATLQNQLQLAREAYNLASRKQDQQYALKALKVQALATQAIEAQRTKNQKSLMQLQAKIQTEMIALEAWVRQLEFSYSPTGGLGTPWGGQAVPYLY